MSLITPLLVFGHHKPGDWISRYCRFRADLPQGRHRLFGEVYNPAGEDLAGNSLLIQMNRVVVGEICSLMSPELRTFAMDLPELAEPAEVQITMRTTRFRLPHPPDVRLLGLVLRSCAIETYVAQPPQVPFIVIDAE